MNLLENYLLEIEKVEKYEGQLLKELEDKSYVKVTATFNCYGIKTKEIDKLYEENKWEEIKRKGYKLC